MRTGAAIMRSAAVAIIAEQPESIFRPSGSLEMSSEGAPAADYLAMHRAVASLVVHGQEFRVIFTAARAPSAIFLNHLGAGGVSFDLQFREAFQSVFCIPGSRPLSVAFLLGFVPCFEHRG
jgi:hypothetical protein